MNDAVKRFSRHVLHHDIRKAFLLTQIVDRYDIGMLQHAGLSRLAIEALQHFRVSGEAFRDGFDRDFAAQMFIEGAIDQTHAAPTEEAGDLVLADPRQRLGTQVLLPSRGCLTRNNS